MQSGRERAEGIVKCRHRANSARSLLANIRRTAKLFPEPRYFFLPERFSLKGAPRLHWQSPHRRSGLHAPTTCDQRVRVARDWRCGRTTPNRGSEGMQCADLGRQWHRPLGALSELNVGELTQFQTLLATR